MLASGENSAKVEAPQSIIQAHVDDKGRLKVPKAIQKYLSDLEDDKFFVTSLDLRIIRLYPMSVWKENMELLEKATDAAEDAEDIAFIAKDLGQDCEPDSQGRLLLPAELRRMLGLENQPVWLDCYKGRINVYGKEIYEERRKRALDHLSDKLQRLERKGLR